MPLTERDYDLLSLYIDDALTPPERRAVESRLASDAEYRAELDALRQTIALVKSLPEMVAPRDLRLTPKMAADVLAELKAAQPAPRPRRTVIQTLTTFAAAAASLVLVLAGALTLMRPGTIDQPATVAVADVMLTEEISTETPTLKLDEDTSTGMLLPQATPMPYATGGFGGDVDPAADTAMMQEAAPTGEMDLFSAVPAPVTAAGEEPPTEVQEEQEAPGDAAGSAAFMSIASATAPATSTLSFPGAVGRTDVTATPDAETANRTMAMPPSTFVAATPSPAATEAALAEMAVLPTMTLESAAEVIETVVADAGDDRAAQDEAQNLEEAAPITEPSSPILGFALVIAGIALGVVALILMVRTG
jgi:hypothetical protein